jgi:DNA-binding transcriptional MerR regulator
MKLYQVKELAQLAGISVRALHYYDEIGLLCPSARTDAGYRLYGQDDVLRLQQIIINRELGLPLEEIRRLLDDPSFDKKAALLRQREELQRRLLDAGARLHAIDAALALLDEESDGSRPRKTTMEPKNLFEGFDPARYDQEAEERWGNTDAFRESKRRTANYTPEDWKRFRAEQAELYGDAYSLLKEGASPTGPRALELAERHRLSIDRWFYPCSHEMHRGRAGLYEQDSRFAENIDRYGPGLTAFLVAAIRENAAQNGS